jgi:hypothetical protein
LLDGLVIAAADNSLKATFLFGRQMDGHGV